MISITILAKNSEATIERTLRSCQRFDEVVLYDTGSTDSTMEIARRFPNVVIHEGPLEGFGPTFNKATDSAKNDWILSVDSDEVLSPELQDEILGLQLEKGSVYSFPRHNYYNGRLIRGCGWYPDRLVRLFNRTETRHSDHLVHPAVQQKGFKEVKLKHPLRHLSYRSTQEFLAKMQHYTTLFADDPIRKKKVTFRTAVWHAIAAFLKTYLLKRGFRDGKEGFIISIYQANSAFYKYLKIWEASIPMEKRFFVPEQSGKS